MSAPVAQLDRASDFGAHLLSKKALENQGLNCGHSPILPSKNDGIVEGCKVQDFLHCLQNAAVNKPRALSSLHDQIMQPPVQHLMVLGTPLDKQTHECVTQLQNSSEGVLWT
jgi:hypothetical protein